MTSSDAPSPKNAVQARASHVASLEQLLTSRQKAPSASLEAGSNHQISNPPAEGASLPVGRAVGPRILVVHNEPMNGSAVKTRLHCVEAEAQLQWLSLQANVVEQVLLVQPYAVVIQFASDALEMAVHVVKQLQQSQPHLPIFALGSTQDPRSMLSALRAGVQDFVDLDAPDQDMVQNFRELLAKGPHPESKQPLKSAPLAVILSARAGVGSSLLAAHLAVYLQQALDERKKAAKSELSELEAMGALLLDLGAPSGDGALYLDLLAEFDFMEAVHSLRRFDKKLASAGLAKHDSGLRLLSLPRQSGLLREVAYAEADLLVQRLREYFQFIVADLGGVSQTNLAIRVASKASKIWVVCDQSLPSVVSTTELLRQLDVQQVKRSAMELIVSSYDRNLELSAQHIADQLELPLLMTLPERRVELLQAVNQGQLLSAQSRREPYVQVIHRLVDILLQSQGLESAPKAGAFSTMLQRMKGR